MQNSRFIKALLRQKVDRTPIWIMRQAGRYLPEYRATRARAGSFMQLCQTPELACEVTLQPLQRFQFDAAIIFSDILTIPDAMGLGLSFIEGEGPRFAKPLTTLADISNLAVPDPQQQLSYVMKAISLVKHELADTLPLIGFAGSPWTLACYMLEGGASHNFHKIKTLLYREPQALQLLLAKLTEAVSLYLQAQLAAGADAIMLFDTWGGILTSHDYQQYSLAYMQQIIRALKANNSKGPPPIIIFTKHGGQWLELIANSGCDAIGLDWSCDLAQAKQRVGATVALQGNMDPAILLSTPARIRQEAHTILTQYGNAPGHIFNLGHGITPDVPIENVEALVAAVQEFGWTES